MKFKIYLPVGLLTIFSILYACVPDDSYKIPVTEATTIELKGTEISMRALKDALLQEIQINGNDLLRIETDSYVSGYVISSDDQGNFFEELIFQNNASEADRGVKLLVDSNPLFQSFEPGRKIYVELKGLTVGFSSGQLSLGVRDGNRLGAISESQLFDFVIRDTIVAAIEPTIRLISELNEDIINTFIRLEHVQFNRNEVLGDDPLTYAGEPDDEFDGERTLESCAENSTIVFSTSTFARFKSVTLPPGSGYVDGIFTYNFFGDEYNVVVNDLSGVQLNDEERCDPAEIDCGVADKMGLNEIFIDFFESQTEGEPIQGNGWTNFIESGTETWEAYFDDGANASLGISARMGSFMSGDESSVGWLITPQINFDLQQGETLHFRTSNSFSDGSILELLFSADWNGDPATIAQATWDLLPAAIIVEDEDFFGDWISSGIVDLSCIEGKGYFAWKYEGSGDADFDGTYELDEIEIRSE